MSHGITKVYPTHASREGTAIMMGHQLRREVQFACAVADLGVPVVFRTGIEATGHEPEEGPG